MTLRRTGERTWAVTIPAESEGHRWAWEVYESPGSRWHEWMIENIAMRLDSRGSTATIYFVINDPIQAERRDPRA